VFAGSTPAQPNLDTISRELERETLELVTPEELREVAGEDELPLAKSARAPPSELPRAHSDDYIHGARDSHIDTMMPLYLSEELSPRFSRAKATKGWNLRREQEQREREAYVKQVVDDWHAKGKDAGLEEAMRQVGISAVRVRGRTADEVREMAAVEYEHMVEERSKLARQAKRVGARHDVDADKWMVPLENTTLKRKVKRARRAARREEALRQQESL
jgi:large subunit ribosomal protein L24